MSATDVTNYFVPDKRQEIGDLPTSPTQQDLIDRINLLSNIVDQMLIDVIGDTGEEIPVERKT
jgi:hypothetical protein